MPQTPQFPPKIIIFACNTVAEPLEVVSAHGLRFQWIYAHFPIEFKMDKHQPLRENWRPQGSDYFLCARTFDK